jgi:ATP-dependent RNA helicase DOB1
MEEKVKGEKLPPQKQLVEAYRQVQETARRVATVWRECKIDVDVEEYVQKISPALMEVIDAWCAGAPFADIMKMTEIYEGSLIRMMRRLEELLRELCHGAKSIGNAELESKFASAMTLLHKDIAFQASLYL